MAHYAFLDENNVVTEVIVGKDEGEDGLDSAGWEEYYGNFRGQVCKKTSYNTSFNAHALGGTPYRGNYAGVGYVFYPEAGSDGFFMIPKPYPSWIINQETATWQAPVPKPEDIPHLVWDETTLNWVESNI